MRCRDKKSRASSTSCCATARTTRRSWARPALARRRSPKDSRSGSRSGTCRSSLRDARILALDHVALLAGTTYRGQYEERIRALVAETRAAPDVMLFIDELHNLIGQGTAMGVAMDAANMLKPALVRGDFRVIGATTSEEYERWVAAIRRSSVGSSGSSSASSASSRRSRSCMRARSVSSGITTCSSPTRRCAPRWSSRIAT